MCRCGIKDLFEWSENRKEWILKGMKSEMNENNSDNIFISFVWCREEWDEWKLEGSNLSFLVWVGCERNENIIC